MTEFERQRDRSDIWNKRERRSPLLLYLLLTLLCLILAYVLSGTAH